MVFSFLWGASTGMMFPLKLWKSKTLKNLRKSIGQLSQRKRLTTTCKGDFVSKGLAVLQTTWFTVQCITRCVVKLDLTQLELATLAFAVLNIILYALWWHKPLAVACSVRVHLRHPTTSDRSEPPPHSSAFARFLVNSTE